MVDPYNFNQMESISIGTVVGSVGATDADTGSNGNFIFLSCGKCASRPVLV